MNFIVLKWSHKYTSSKIFKAKIIQNLFQMNFVLRLVNPEIQNPTSKTFHTSINIYIYIYIYIGN